MPSAETSPTAHTTLGPREAFSFTLCFKLRDETFEDDDPGMAAFFNDIGANVATDAAWSATMDAMAGTLNLLNTQPATQ